MTQRDDTSPFEARDAGEMIALASAVAILFAGIRRRRRSPKT